MKKLTLFLFFAVLFLNTAQARRIFVAQGATGTGDGSSWANAYLNIPAAISAALSGDEIWVKQGTHLAGPPPLSATNAFVLKSGVLLYGGFSGTETALTQRDFVNNLTILNGLGSVFNVVRASGVSAATRLDGFVITGGNANIPSGVSDNTNQGGGIYINNGSPIIANCTISSNQALAGGSGIEQAGSSSASKIQNCVLRENGNEAIGVDGGGTMRISGSTIAFNQISAITASCALTIDRCTISGNSASSYVVYSDGTTLLTNTLIVGNSASGKVLAISGGNSTVTNCTIANNSQALNSNVIYILNGANPANTVISNTAIWQNSNNVSAVQFATGQPYSYGLNNAFANTPLPRFVSPGATADAPFSAADYDYHLQANSPFIDAGTDNTATSGNDLDTNPRIFGNHVDIGAYESSYVATITAQTGNIKLLKILPNPVTNYCTLDLTALENPNMINITDTNGKLLLSKNIQNNSNPQIDMADFANGIYLLQVVTDAYSITQKIAVAR
jgi:trimeric autotransporter adhesin